MNLGMSLANSLSGLHKSKIICSVTPSGDDGQRLKRSMRAFKSALAWGMELLGHVGQHCKWPHMVRSEVAIRVNEITKLPLEVATKRRIQMAPTTWAAECCAHALWARGLIEMMHPAITTEDWSLMDCQEYFVDLVTSLTGVAKALEVSAPGQLRDDQMGVYRELELEVGVACGLANKFREKHLEEYDLRRNSAAAAGPSGVIEKLKAGRLKLDVGLSPNREAGRNEQGALASRAGPDSEEDSRRPGAPPPSPPDQEDPSEGAWPWLSGQLDDLLWENEHGKTTSDVSIMASLRRCWWEACASLAWRARWAR
jgi:hypothetical protein